jgi:hypothetical protein
VFGCTELIGVIRRRITSRADAQEKKEKKKTEIPDAKRTELVRVIR